MFKILKTDVFEKWFTKLRDSKGKSKILTRLKRIELGNLGDCKSLGGSLSELRIDFGPGYRVYVCKKEKVVIVLLCGGDKSTQQADIQKARQILVEIGD